MKENIKGEIYLSRLSIVTSDRGQQTIEVLYKDLERRIVASPLGLCPIDLTSSFLKMCHAQTCGKCVPCRVGLGQLITLLENVLDGKAELSTIDLIEKTARSIYHTADCAIGYEAAQMVLKGIEGFRDDFEEHILLGRCKAELDQTVPCVSLCPSGVDIPGYVALVNEGRYVDAIKLIRKDNPMPLVCGLICEHPCETRCRRNILDDSINIKAIKRFAVDNAGDVPLPKNAPSTGKRVAIIGAGPSGLTAGYFLSLMGHEVEIFEQRKHLGGMLRYGIPSYRLPREDLQKEIDTMLATGIKVHTDFSIGKDMSFEELREKFDAVYIAIGAHTDKKIDLGAQETNGIISAVEVLRRAGDHDPLDLEGKKVVVIGGGNVAMDVARSSIRFGAEKVSVVYRRRKVDMTALDEEVEGAVAESCEILDLHTPVRVEKDENNNIKALWVQPQVIGKIPYDRPVPVDADVDPIRLECDILVTAVGQGVESRDFEKEGIPVIKGVIDALNWSGIKDTPGVYAGGDCVSGPATVIMAIGAGKVAAANIDEYLGFNHIIESDVEIPEPALWDRVSCGRVNLSERDAQDRIKDFGLIELGMTCEEATQESGRCLRCDHFGLGALKGGRTVRW